MVRRGRNRVIIVFLLLVIPAGFSFSGDRGFFRTIPVETPERGVLRISNTSFYSDIPINDVLIRRYGVSDTRIFSSVTEFELGVTNSLTLNGSLPYYADLFKQGTTSGKKTGAGDVVFGLRLSRRLHETMFRGFNFGSRIRMPEQLGYGTEPLGFRTFSYGDLAYSIEASTGLRFKFMDWNVSVSMLQFPRAAKTDSVFVTDAFYDTGFGYMGIGQPDEAGYAAGIFQNQLHMSVGTVVPVRSWLSALVEFNATSFIEKPHRENIVTLAPGFRFGSAEGFNFSIAMDYALKGAVPERTFMFRFRIPTLSARGIKELLVKPRIGDEIRSKNSLVAIHDFSKRDITYLYEKDLKRTLHDYLGARGFLDVVPQEKVEQVFQQRALVPLPEKSRQLGVRLGANYLINNEVLEFKVDRSSSFTIPFLISFPETNFSLTAQSSVTDLVTGETQPLGMISATVAKPRGINYFPFSPSSDIVYLSEPERRTAERELIDRWVETFNEVIFDKIEFFGWEPRQSEINGDVETEG